MSNFGLYSFCLIVTASLVALLAMSTDFFVAYVNDIIIPCQHDSSWTGTQCNCDNTRGVFSGQYCGECECKHLGICAVVENGNSRWGCRCPSHEKWTGVLCDKCYTANHNETLNQCSGPCQTSETHIHYGPKCDTVCIPKSNAQDQTCQEIASGGGTCNACNGHGTCSGTGQCECEDGWYTSLGGEQCSMSCDSSGIVCPPDRGICQSIGGIIQCICRPGFYGANCELTCESTNNKPCSGHGTCGLTSLGAPTCTCETHYVGNMCQHACPGNHNYSSACSGHGTCQVEEDIAVCKCSKDSNWLGFDCSCNQRFTCSGHGTCNNDATCDCNDWDDPSHQHWNGTSCHKCKEHWYGAECQMYCNPDEDYISDSKAGRVGTSRRDGQQIGCNTRGTCEIIKKGNKEHVECSCSGMDPESFCARCEKYQYPKVSILEPSVNWCSQTCGEDTCNSGTCNPGYNGSNDLCNCNTITIGTLTLSTLDPAQYCLECKANWYPSAGSNRCTRYCASEGLINDGIILFDNDTLLQGDANAKKVCVGTDSDGYTPDADCRVCSKQGTCGDDAQCVCNDGVTGLYCEIDCGQDTNGIVCSGHGRCVRNDLDLWFNPKTSIYRCECEPFDTYTAATRQRLLKQGFQVDPPPSPNYYGKYCNYHCPRYNKEICTGRGTCTTAIAVQESGTEAGYFKSCNEDVECSDIPGAFCERLSTPWDSLMDNSKSFFSNSIESPGYVNCAPNQECVDSIYSIKWDEYCVNMLNGWYPNVLNTATCAYQSGCMDKIENFFAQTSSDTQKTWCQLAVEKMSPMKSSINKCYENSDNHDSVKTPICQGYDLNLACNNQEMCIYEQRFDKIKEIDDNCAAKTRVQDCTGACKLNFNNECITKTYCRAKTCEDAINEVNIETTCIDTVNACPSTEPDYWIKECSTIRGKIRKDSSMLAKETFFTCMMKENSKNPQTVLANIPGNIRIDGKIEINHPIEETVNIQDLRAQFILSRTLTSDTCSEQFLNHDFDTFCQNHVMHSIPTYTKPPTLNGEWFYEYLVVCPRDEDNFFYKESIHKDKNKALDRIEKLNGRQCTPKYKCIQATRQSWGGSCKEINNEEFNPKPYKLECLNQETQYFDKLDYTKYPANPSSCVLTSDENLLRWGGKRWTLDILKTEFEESCEMKPSWIPQEKKIPSLCDMDACGTAATMCMECPEDIDCASGVLCGSKIPVDCHIDNPCGNGGHCHVPEKWPNNRYVCEWNHTNVRIFAEQKEFNGELTARGDLTIFNFVPETDDVEMVVMSQNVFSSQNITDWHKINAVNSIMTWKETFEQCPNSKFYCPQSKTWQNNCSTCGNYKYVRGHYCSIMSLTCEVDNSGCNYSAPTVVPKQFEECTEDNDYNWFEYCTGKTNSAKILDTSPSFGLIQPWSGEANLLYKNRLHLQSAKTTTSGQTIVVQIDLQRSDANSALSMTLDDGSEFIVNTASASNSNLSITKNLLSLDIEYSISNSSIELKSLFGIVIIRSIRLDGHEQIKLYKDSFAGNDRIINMGTDSNYNGTDYKSWEFDFNSMVFHREASKAFIEKTCSLATNDTCSVVTVPHGSQWNLPEHHDFRVHGWSKFDNGASPLINQLDENGKIANMKILNGDSTAVFEMYVLPIVGTEYGKIHYAYNDVDSPTSCKVQINHWWHWQIDLTRGNHSLKTTTEDMYLQNILIPNGTKTYNQLYSAKLKVNDCEISIDSIKILTSARELTHSQSVAASFHSLKSEEHECRRHCHKHEDCVQWSWTPSDTHCYLHSSRCHEDENCMLGSHTLKAFHPQTTTKFEVYNEAPNIRTWWNSIRFEPLIAEPFTCSEINIETEIPLLWKELFRDQYVPLKTDATGICNAIATQWQTIPGYTSGVCEGEECAYDNNDMQACAHYLEHKVPKMNISGCDEDLDKFNNLDWWSYCLYQQSFIPTDGPDFLGGPDFLTDEAGNVTNFDAMCQNTNAILNKTQECDVQIEWYEQCFERTKTYKEFCSVECIKHIEKMFDEDEESPSICSIRKDFLQIGDSAKMGSLNLEAIDGCNDCDMSEVIISDFCSLQQVYHTTDNRILVPELSNSQCSTECQNTLRDSMTRTDVRNWCENLSNDTLSGTCSKTSCECDTESYAGVAGGICELTCPTGQQGDEELACSGRNGRCFGKNDAIPDEIEQRLSGEYRNVSSNYLPKWMKGPSPSIQGVCQCAMGSGIACSIPCDRCNNGTYGYEMSSQYGICDSFNGVCRGLAPYMRYNTKFATGKSYISYNTTGFEGIQWEYPERFLYENDTTLMNRATSYILDSDGLKPEYLEQNETDLITKTKIDFVLHNFAALCWDYGKPPTDFQYTNNGKATFGGISLETSKNLKNITIEGVELCMLIQIPDTKEWYLCFHDGKMHARDENDARLMVIESGNSNVPKQGMTFCAQSSEVVYAFGGEIKYSETMTESFNNVYKIDIQRFAWNPLDIITVNWNMVDTDGTAPKGQTFAPLVCYEMSMYVVSNDHRVYQFKFPDAIETRGKWLNSSEFDEQSAVYNVVQNTTAFDIVFDSNVSKTYTLFAEHPFSNSSKNKNDVININATTYVQESVQKCEMKLDGNKLTVGGIDIAEAKTRPTFVKIFLEEWVNIDYQTGADIYKRFHNTIQFKNDNVKEPSFLLDVQKLRALEFVERIYMHQGRWEMNAMIQRKKRISDTLWTNNEYFSKLAPSSESITEKFKLAFNAIPLNYFDTDPKTDAVEYFKITWEGKILIITANFNADLSTYKQKFYIGQHLILLEMHKWESGSFHLSLRIDNGNIEWQSSNIVRSFILTLPLERWSQATNFTYEGKTGFTALFDMTVMKETSRPFTMQSQLAKFLSYSSSHCSITASTECPGTLPYLFLPCSGRGRCGISCQCACEIAPSELQKNPNALNVPDWKKSPYRGDGCEKICPGYDGYNLETICSGRGVCQYDGKCTCPTTHTGDSCQFECPVGKDGFPCSNNGGCGTKAVKSSSFIFNGDDYLDGVTAINKKSYSSALNSFYTSCKEHNYIEQRGVFNSENTRLANATTKHSAFESCDSTNVDRNIKLIRNKEFRDYPYETCLGVTNTSQEMYSPVLLKQPQWETSHSLQSLPLFTSAGCSMVEHPDNEAGIVGMTTTLLSCSFEFNFKYIHGKSSGSEHYIVNGFDFIIETEWNLEKLTLTLSSPKWNVDSPDVFEFTGEIVMITLLMESESFKIKVYKSFSPQSGTEQIFLAPLYENNYMRILDETPIYALVSDHPSLQFDTTEYLCDLEPKCLGIIQWTVPFRENLFTMYSEVPLEGFEEYSMNEYTEYIVYKKMSLVYQGRTSSTSSCDVVKPGLAKYPSVSYSETYDMPINNIDLSLSTDADTNSIIIGNGLWSNCWKRYKNIRTKKDCKDQAVTDKVYGFAFSDDEKICIVYHEMDDANKIKLGRYNSESRRTLFNPCGITTKWISM